MMRLSRPQLLAGLLALVVVVAVVAGIVVVGSPAEQRTQRLDERRVGDLASIAQAADLYWTRHAQLPTSLNELTSEPGTRLRANDPETNAPYEYPKVGRFILRSVCAVSTTVAAGFGSSGQVLAAR